MSAPAGALVAIVREFCTADRLLREIVARFARSALRFDELTALVGDDDSSVLFRLKERSHALFRQRGAVGSMRREALFDLAVGSLFHEAMSFRENFYQREVYGPKVRALRGGGDSENDALFREFEKILAVADQRLRDGVSELTALLGRTREQLLSMLGECRDDGALARHLIESRSAIEPVFELAQSDLLARVFGSVERGFELAARSYLATGYYADAEAAFDRAAPVGARADLGALRDCASGLGAFLSGDYARSIEQLARWWRCPALPLDRDLAALAATISARLAKLGDGPGQPALAAEARRLEQSIRERLAEARAAERGNREPGERRVT
jgi:hypothetical protein